jgi:hypothetical protein
LAAASAQLGTGYLSQFKPTLFSEAIASDEPHYMIFWNSQLRTLLFGTADGRIVNKGSAYNAPDFQDPSEDPQDPGPGQQGPLDIANSMLSRDDVVADVIVRYGQPLDLTSDEGNDPP